MFGPMTMVYVPIVLGGVKLSVSVFASGLHENPVIVGFRSVAVGLVKLTTSLAMEKLLVSIAFWNVNAIEPAGLRSVVHEFGVARITRESRFRLTGVSKAADTAFESALPPSNALNPIPRRANAFQISF